MDYSTKKILLNHQIFMEKLLANPNFFLEILKWKDKLRITNRDLGNFYGTKKAVYLEGRNYGIKLMEKIVREENIEFISWLNKFSDKYKLNENWKQRIIDYIACGYYCPPTKSIHAFINKERSVITLKISADITKEDFYETWKEVKEKIKELPKRKKRSFSSKSFRSLEDVLRANKFRAEGIKGMDLAAYLSPNDDGDEMESLPSKEADEKIIKNLKIKRQRLQRRGYQK